MPNGPPKIDEEVMRSLWLDEVPIGKIAAHFGCKPPAISRWAKLHWLPRRNNRGVLIDAPKPTSAPRRKHQPAYLSKPETDPAPERPVLRYTYSNVQELVARGMSQRQALAEFHRRRM